MRTFANAIAIAALTIVLNSAASAAPPADNPKAGGLMDLQARVAALEAANPGINLAGAKFCGTVLNSLLGSLGPSGSPTNGVVSATGYTYSTEYTADGRFTSTGNAAIMSALLLVPANTLSAGPDSTATVTGSWNLNGQTITFVWDSGLTTTATVSADGNLIAGVVPMEFTSANARYKGVSFGVSIRSSTCQ